MLRCRSFVTMHANVIKISMTILAIFHACDATVQLTMQG
jgi:hypothetical protein